jgi:hypothetical protein
MSALRPRCPDDVDIAQCKFGSELGVRARQHLQSLPALPLGSPHDFKRQFAPEFKKLFSLGHDLEKGVLHA